MTTSYRHPTSLPLRLISKFIRTVLHTPLGIALLGVSKFFYPRKDGDWVEVVRFELPLARLAPQFAGLRLVQISDIHIGTWMTRSLLAEAVERVNAENPDIVAITGDFVTYDAPRFARDLAEELACLAPRYATLAVLGNHDHWSGAETLRRIFADSNIIDLSNRVYTLHHNGTCLHFAGVDDFMNDQDRLHTVLEAIPADGAAILLVHEPDFADISAASRRFDLQISGHTHGGQVLLPLLGAPFLPSYGRKYYSGLYHVDGMLQYTNRGLGTAELQVRLNCRPEITVITLQPSGSSSYKTPERSDSF